jgi:superfamily II DNA helicase RecQ
MSYQRHISSLAIPSFDAIRRVAVTEINKLSESVKNDLWRQLNRGTAILETHEQMCQYLFSFGNMHQAKLLDAFKKLPQELLNSEIEIVDWGCGQAIGTIVLLDHIANSGIKNKVKRVTLIEPSKKALERARLHVELYNNGSIEVNTISKYFELIDVNEIKSNNNRGVIHIFSNILDVAAIDLKHLANLVDRSVDTENYLVCVGPLNPTNQRIDAFFRYFDLGKITNLYEFENTDFHGKGWTVKSRIYKLEPNQSGHLIRIEYYPTVQFHAAYELDCVKDVRVKSNTSFWEDVTRFEVAAPFDLGASVYDDVHPVLVVLNNIISRGLPTKSSVFIEEAFLKAFSITRRVTELGEIKFDATNNTPFDLNLFWKYVDTVNGLTENDKIQLQILLTPIAIARFQKVLLEAIITGHLDITKDKWQILIEEKDVPFGELAIADFKNTFGHLIALTQEFEQYKLPEIDLFVISNADFIKSPLHTINTYKGPTPELLNKVYDMVVTQAVLKSASTDIESFSEYKANNNCYFNIRSANAPRTNRVIYTSDLIKYKNLVSKNRQGVFEEIESAKENLTYFLKLFFRKEQFRPGQLPILDRALQNLPVIGLLPTGGGKSLTYQISALLQPGVTLVVDPLKSLMKDQYDGLLKSGIDTASYINSTLTADERKHRENQLESSQLQFIFLSPERLAIASFRERLKNMHEYNVYFSYGVIDEVHCVSEWGHDFRFSYLHLGRNLYNYVRSKQKEISLFGLTATASFDVLADVERELSGNGAFELDADVIVRYENTNRLELQYKIEKVNVEFEVDKFFDKDKKLADHLPKALNITNHWTAFDSKAEFLRSYVKRVGGYLNEIQQESNIKFIKDSNKERQNSDEGTDAQLTIEIASDLYSPKDEYKGAGIIFCTHVDNTGLSVRKNAANLKSDGIIDVASFTGKDDDETSMQSLDAFRNNKSPLMVATKAFGMGIDKPNVRFTVNMNYSSSLESFVQEAGRAGRDKNIAISSILVSDYKLVQISRNFNSGTFPIPILKNKWFKENDLHEILNYYNVNVPNEYLVFATPSNDIVKLHCSKDNVMFAFNRCDESCTEFKRCKLKNVKQETKGWKAEGELIQELRAQNINISKKNFQYLNADYQTVMYFFNEAFKGDFIEKMYMHQLLSTSNVFIEKDGVESFAVGFLSTLRSSEDGAKTIVYVPYSSDDYADLSKAIYRMTCIDLIEDFTQDYRNQRFRIVANKKGKGGYFDGLKTFLLRYYTTERANLELNKVKDIPLNKNELDPLDSEIYKCLAYLTEFVYDKISEKRKRAIDDMRNFCMEGLSDKTTWIEANESLKDFIYYYFNSKYAKSDYVADNGEPYSLVNDTDGGKISHEDILQKYLLVISDEIVGFGTPLDNVKHLYGAVRLISRSLTDSNPALYLLEAFCLAYMGTKGNKNLEEQLIARYSEGMIEFYNRPSEYYDFEELFNHFNASIYPYLSKKEYQTLVEETYFLIQMTKFRTVKNKYLEVYE